MIFGLNIVISSFGACGIVILLDFLVNVVGCFGNFLKFYSLSSKLPAFGFPLFAFVFEYVMHFLSPLVHFLQVCYKQKSSLEPVCLFEHLRSF